MAYCNIVNIFIGFPEIFIQKIDSPFWSKKILSDNQKEKFSDSIYTKDRHNTKEGSQLTNIVSQVYLAICFKEAEKCLVCNGHPQTQIH